MNREQIRRTLVTALSNVAPEADPATLAPDADLREELDIDSMDFLRFVTELHRATSIEIPEADYPRLFTLGGAEAYLMERTGA